MTVIAVFAILSGLAEIVVGFTGNFMRILSKELHPSKAVAIVGALYALGGLSLLTNKQWGAALGIVFIVGEILGRIFLVITGVAPSKGTDLLKIVVGGAIAFAILVYIWFAMRGGSPQEPEMRHGARDEMRTRNVDSELEGSDP